MKNHPFKKMFEENDLDDLRCAFAFAEIKLVQTGGAKACKLLSANKKVQTWIKELNDYSNNEAFFNTFFYDT